MSWIKGLIIFLIVVAAVVIGYLLYSYLGSYKGLSAENQQLQEEVAQLRASLEEVEATRGELAEKSRGVEDLKADAEALSRERNDLERELQEARGRFQEVSQELAAREEKHQKESQEQAVRIRHLESEVASLKEEYPQKVQSLEGLLTQRDRQIQDLQAGAEQLRQTITALEGDTEALSRERDDLKGQLQEARSRLQEASQGVAFRESKLEELEQAHLELVRQLKEQIKEKEVEISTLAEKLNIRFLDKVLFHQGNAVITSGGREALKNVAEELKNLTGTRIHVEGHSDNLPLSEEARVVYIDNLGLSMARAAAVARMFRTMGVNPEVLSAAGYSMHKPVASNDTPEGREQNRRVEIILMPLR
ncbi:MAG: OmpA family protein [candidate division Zixibacteria bacterium]|nr:OmpA family protein [candidate division Zixibacteria bacterium]